VNTLAYGILGSLVVALILWLLRMWWSSRHRRVLVELEDGPWWHVTNGSEPIRVNAVGARIHSETDWSEEDVTLRGQRVHTIDHRQDNVITMQPHAEQRFGPTEDLAAALLRDGVRVVNNTMRLRPFVRIDGHTKPCYGQWLMYDLQKSGIAD
jgi:hypothetical protein